MHVVVNLGDCSICAVFIAGFIFNFSSGVSSSVTVVRTLRCSTRGIDTYARAHVQIYKHCQYRMREVDLTPMPQCLPLSRSTYFTSQKKKTCTRELALNSQASTAGE